MTTPNVVNVQNINGNTVYFLANTTTTNIITNVMGSNSLIKVNTIMISNYSGNTITANVMVNRGGTQFYINGNITVPTYSTLIGSSKDSAFYMNEGDILQANVSANTSANFMASYEVIS
jgi:hypothetical protein